MAQEYLAGVSLQKRKWQPDDFAAMLIGHVPGGVEGTRSWLEQAGALRGATNPGMAPDTLVELGIVNLVDERLELAENRLHQALFRHTNRSPELTPLPPTPMSTVARIALAWSSNRRRHFDDADEALRSAISMAHELRLAAIGTVAYLMWLQNRSDMGAPSDSLHELLEKVSVPVVQANAVGAPGIKDALACFRTLTRAKLIYRSGKRREALDLLLSFLTSVDEQRAAQSPILYGSLQRMRGILYTFSGNLAAARDDFRVAQRRFEEVGYDPGVIRCTQSMARSSLFLDRQEAERAIQRARQLMEEHEAGLYPREMKAERAYLESNIGDIFFAKGDFDRALEHYQADHALTESIGSPKRAMAYIYYNIGRVYTALGRFAEAAESLGISSRLFEEAGDFFNVVRTGLGLTMAYIEAAAFTEAMEQLRAIDTQLTRLGADPSRQPKQQAMLQILWALLDLRHSRDKAQATARIGRVKELLSPFPRDSYFVRALLVEAEVEVARNQKPNAAALIAWAERLAEAGYMTDLKQTAAGLRRRFGLPDVASNLIGPLQKKCGQSTSSRVNVSAAILMVEVRGYTDFTDELGARSVSLLENLMVEFADAMTGCAELHDGELVRFDGNSLQVVFEDRVMAKEIKAVQAALLMTHRFRDIQARWMYDRRLSLSQELALGLGIASGPVIAGHFGRATRHDFVLIGGAVNQAIALARGGRDGDVLVSREVARILEREWPSVHYEPREVAEGGGRTFACAEIDAGRYYPLPRLTSEE